MGSGTASWPEASGLPDAAAVAALAATVPGLGTVRGVHRDGAGWDHVAWQVDTDDGPWIVRVATAGDAGERAAGVRREVAVMQLVRRRLGGWAADAAVVDAGLGCLAHRRIAGTSLQHLLVTGPVPPEALAGIAGTIGRLAREIGTLDPAEASEELVRDDDGPAAWVAEAPRFVDEVGHLLGRRRWAAVQRFLAARPPDDPDHLLLQHNDLGAEHVMVDPATWTITGIIDWSDAAVTDPAADLGRLLRDLRPSVFERVLDGHGDVGPARAGLVERAWCYARCLSLEDLAYAVARRPDLVTVELATVDALFG